jgi:PAS domain S-box-containing protein
VILTGPDSESPIYVSENSLKITGYSPEELKCGFREFARETDRERVALAIREAFAKRSDFDGFEFDAARKDGVPWQASASWRSIFDDSGAYKGRVFQVIDVTRLRRAESALRESEQKYRAIADYTVDWESWFGPSGECLWVNPAVEQITGYAKEEILAMPDFIPVLIAEEDRPVFIERFQRAIRGREPNSGYELRFLRKDGTLRWLSVAWTPIFDDGGRYLGIRVSGRDVTDRRLGEERIAQLLAEKELLLREVHHRIKNNMGLIASMFSIQADMISDPAASSALSDMRGRLMGMMILYDKLYRSEGFQELSTRGYLGALLDGIADEYSGSSGALLSWDIVDRVMDSRILFPLGIIVNELVTNAFKYAFPKGEPGLIALRFREAEAGCLELRVADDGIGVADSALACPARGEGAGGFGFLLVKTLTEQIGAKLELGRNGGRGTEFLLRFSIGP